MVWLFQTDDPENPIIMLLEEEVLGDNKKMNLMLEKNISILQVV